MLNAQGLRTERLRLILKMPTEVRAAIEGMADADKAQLSAEWLAISTTRIT